MNKKALQEQKAELLNKMEQLTSKAEVETRALNDEEIQAFEDLKKQVEQISKTLEIFDTQKEMVEEQPKNEEKEVDKMDTEKRALIEQEIRIMHTGTHSETVPTQLSEEVIKKLEELSDVIAEANVVNVKGDYEVLVEKNTNGMAQILGETERLTSVDLGNFDTVKLSDKRIATEVVVSEKILNNSPVLAHEDIVSEVANYVHRRLEHEIFNANGGEKEFGKGLINAVEAKEVAKVDTDELMEMVVGFNPALLNGAKFYVNRQDLIALSKLKDATGKYYLTLENIVNEGPHYMIMGIKVAISDYVPVGTIILANVSKAYKLKVNGDMSVKTLVEKYSDIGSVGFIVNAYFDGAVVNKQAVKVLKLTSARTK